MISTVDILLHPKNLISFKDVVVIDLTNATPMKAAELIKAGTYDASCDVNADGYLDVNDYNKLYDMWFGKYDAWAAGEMGPYGTMDARMIVRIKKYVTGELTGYEADFDLDNDGHITEIDLKIARYWLLAGKVDREVFE